MTEDLSRSFYACIKIRYTDGYETWTPGQSFNAQVGAWQYLSHVFTLDDGTDTERTPESVTYYLCYYRNANTAYFDNIQLIREDVPSYTYDNNGDLVSVTGRETTSQFSSDNGTLTKMVDTKEAYAYYNYSRETNTLLGARTKSGVEYTFTYDGNGNVTGYGTGEQSAGDRSAQRSGIQPAKQEERALSGGTRRLDGGPGGRDAGGAGCSGRQYRPALGDDGGERRIRRHAGLLARRPSVRGIGVGRHAGGDPEHVGEQRMGLPEKQRRDL